jgi:hypothetical protein
MNQTPDQQKRYFTYREFISAFREPVEPTKGLLNRQSLTGMVFGKLWISGPVPGYATRFGVLWRCRCSCGSKRIVEVWSKILTQGHVTDCGCRAKWAKRRKRDRRKKARKEWKERIRLATMCQD